MTDAEILAALTSPQAAALTIWAEARGEPIQGQIGVGCVIRNRARDGRYGGGTLKAVCLHPAQFSCWDPGSDANHQALLALARQVVAHEPITVAGAAQFAQATWIADGLDDGRLLDCTRGADHYVTTDTALHNPPTWLAKMRPCGALGNHSFFKRTA